MDTNFTFSVRDRVVLHDQGTWHGEVTGRRFVGAHEIVVVKWDDGFTESVEAELLALETPSISEGESTDTHRMGIPPHLRNDG